MTEYTLYSFADEKYRIELMQCELPTIVNLQTFQNIGFHKQQRRSKSRQSGKSRGKLGQNKTTWVKGENVAVGKNSPI